MWCIRRPSRVQVRTVVLEVARPPAVMATVWPGASGPAAWSSVTRIRQPPAGTGPATAMSPPRLTRTPQPRCRAISSAQRSAAQALAVAPRSSCAPPASRPGGPVSSCTLRQPGTAGRSGGGGYGAGRRAGQPGWHRPHRLGRSRGRSPAPASARPQVGSTSPSVSRAARRASASRSANSSLMPVVAPPGRVQRRQLGVGPEPAAGQVHRGQLGVGEPPGGGQRACLGDQQDAVVPNTPKVSRATAG